MLALFSCASAKLGRIVRLVVIGVVALSVVGIGGPVSADPPDENGNHHHGGGGGGGGGDTIAPDAVTDLTAQAGALGAISLSWMAVGDDGGGVDCTGAGRASDYDLRYSSSSPLDPPYNGDEPAWFNDAIPGFWEPLPFRSGPLPCGATETFCIPGLDAGSTYYAALTVEDEAGNVSELSNVASAMAGSTLGLFTHVEGVQVGWLGQGGKRKGIAQVTIHDESGAPVEGATVTGEWTGCLNGQSGSAVTDCNGLAIIQRNKVCTWGDNCDIVFTVTAVSHDASTYDPEANGQTSDSMICF